ncbi:hypothetical protein GUJ93_ZPchr0012g21151 [Zizania palustris]|uniref:Uncharacterized protein n=1 Tax=Zizania palustris TaxID=103762 RepID=A0A8J5WTE3_ZIZPA|nr:hypothetical protein GUJ93_ZPchr0012g21151 [Zizania palustris]
MLDRSQRQTAAEAGEGGGNADRVLFKNLVDVVPLVESLVVIAQISLGSCPPAMSTPSGPEVEAVLLAARGASRWCTRRRRPRR